MKKKLGLMYPDGRGTPKILKIMKLTLMMHMLVLWHVSASSYSQEVKLNLNLQNASVKEVFSAIKTQSNFTFIYNEEDINEVSYVSLKVTNQSVENVLSTCLANSGLTWKVVDEVIVIVPGKDKSAQEDVIVKGKVTDENDQPIPGVNIILLEFSTGTISMPDGTYELKVPGGEGSLAFTFIGFQKQVISLNGRTEINVRMLTEVSELTDVVVTGFGPRDKKTYTGSAVTISGEKLLEVGNANVLNSLSTIDPSFLMVENNLAGSDPNSLPEFNMRGSSSIPGLDSKYSGNPNMPTFIIDGFQVSAEVVFDLDPYRVKSITLLKDASATAIYGSRGANGVVVIETIPPVPGKIQVSYNGGLTYTEPDLTDYDLLNAREKLQLEKESGYYTRKDAMVSIYEDLEREYNERLKLVEQGIDTYWLSKPVKRAFGHTHSLLFEGGDESFRYGVNVNHRNNPGVMKESGRKRNGMGINLQYMVDNFTFMNKMTYESVKSFESPYGSFAQYARLNPYFRPKDDNGNYLMELSGPNIEGNYYNPLYNTGINSTNESGYSRFSNNFSIDWRMSKASTLRGSFSIEQRTDNGDVFLSARHTDFIDYLDPNAGDGNDVYRMGTYTKSNGESYGYEGKLNYSFSKQIDKSLLYFNIGINMQEQTSENYTVVAEGFPNEYANSIEFAKQYQKDGRPTGNEYTSRLLGSLGAFNYSYDNRYMADVSFRVDGSSRFGADSRWAPFWSSGLGWNIHNEKFFKSSKAVNLLKLRGSYGITGSQEYDPYMAMMTYEYYNDTRYHYGYGATLKAMGNRDLNWQKTIMANFGVDGSFLQNRIDLSANIYRNLSKDVLTPVTLPSSLGFSSYMENLGEVENKGVELQLNLFLIKNVEKQLTWSVGGSAVYNANALNKISNSLHAINENTDAKYNGTTQIKEPEEEKEVFNRPRVRYMEGESVNTIWAVRSLGIDPASGTEVFLNKDGQKTYTWSAEDMVAVGKTDPKLRGNISTFLRYKGWQMNMYFTYRLGGQMYNQTLVDRVENADKRYNVDQRVLDERWRNPGDITFFKRVSDPYITKPSSRFVEDYSFINFSSFNLSYEFNEVNLQKLGMKRLKAIFNMNDVFRSSTVKIERGIHYPFARTFTFSLQATI